MVLLTNLSHCMDICSLFKFGNRSWLGTPFSSQQYYFDADKHETGRSGREKGVAFDFGDNLKVL
ncbi:MAG: hypothetical protein ACOZF0_21380 [Thermodesulfobacteriota bacterium]